MGDNDVLLPEAIRVDVVDNRVWSHTRNGRRHRYQWHREVGFLYSKGQTAPHSTVKTKHLLGTVTLCNDYSSPHFNRWFAEVIPPHMGDEVIKSGPLMSLADAKAWVEVMERMNR